MASSRLTQVLAQADRPQFSTSISISLRPCSCPPRFLAFGPVFTPCRCRYSVTCRSRSAATTSTGLGRTDQRGPMRAGQLRVLGPIRATLVVKRHPRRPMAWGHIRGGELSGIDIRDVRSRRRVTSLQCRPLDSSVD